MIKKHFCTLLTGAFSLASWLSGGPLVQNEISKDAQWLAHIDMEGIMDSSFSDFGVSKLKEAIANASESKFSIDVDMVLAEIKSVTAYGASFDEKAADDSVIVLKTGDRLQAIFDGFVAHQELEGEESPLKRVDDKPYEAFLLDEELFVAFPHKNYAIAGKNFESIERAYAVIDGKKDSLNASKDKLILNGDGGFFLMVTARGINELKNVPPQARMLQKTKGGQLSVGEIEGEFRANVVLTTASREISMQLYRIVQGMLALASFTQLENQSMMEVVESVDVRQGDDFVSLDFSYPMDKLMGLINSVMDSGQGHHQHPDHSSHSWNQQEEAAEKQLVEDRHG